jgi:hypothetical protein
VRWALCTGTYKNELIMAVRGRSPQGGAGQLVQQIVGAEGTAGGHGVMASGHVPLHDRDPQQIVRELSHRALRVLGVPPDEVGQPLLRQDPGGLP